MFGYGLKAFYERENERMNNTLPINKVIVALSFATALAGCQTLAQERAATGALLGGAAGAAIGGAAGGSAGSALAGGAIGAVTGGAIGAATAPRGCYVRDRYGRPLRVRC